MELALKMASLQTFEAASSFLNSCFKRKLYSVPIGNLLREAIGAFSETSFSLVCTSVHSAWQLIQEIDFMELVCKVEKFYCLFQLCICNCIRLPILKPVSQNLAGKISTTNLQKISTSKSKLMKEARMSFTVKGG